MQIRSATWRDARARRWERGGLHSEFYTSVPKGRGATMTTSIPKYVVTSDGTHRGTMVLDPDGSLCGPPHLETKARARADGGIFLELQTTVPIGVLARIEVPADQVVIKYESIWRQIWQRVQALYNRADMAFA